MSHDSRPPSWWQTVPGALTAVAAVITAVTGFVLALGQLGLLGTSERPLPQRDGADLAAISTPSGAAAAAPEGSTPGPPAFEPALREVSAGEAKYVILGLRTEPRNPESFSLRISIRMLNQAAYPANFWDATFRLLVDGVPRSPVGGLNEVVEGRSAEEGEVEFIVPSDAASLVLRLHSPSETVEVPLRHASR